MKKTFSLFALLAAMGLVVVLAGCGGKTNNTTSSNTTKPQPSTSDTSATSATQTPSQSQSQTQAAKAPVITVEPQTVEINAGEEVDLLFGVSATDEVDGRVNVIVLDDDDFDKDVPGTYVITYKAVNSKGKEATATRTIVVGQPLSQLALEVRENKLGEQKWTGKLINFAHELFVEVTANQEFTKRSGVFYNSSDAQVTISVEGGYGVSAILDKNGVVIEGRDGANGKLVNAQNPSRASSSVNTLDGETTVVSAFAQNMVIPAKGYAVVIQANYAGTTADSDGRGFMNYNVIYEYGNVVKLFWVDDNTVITPYANQAPKVSGNTEVNVFLNSDTVINDAVKDGIVAKDDNGTFETSDDVEIEEITIESNGGFDISVLGSYTFNLSVTDGTLKTEFTRVVTVIANENAAVVAVGDNEFTTLKDDIAIDQDLTGVGTYSFIVYTPTFIAQHEELGFENGWSEAFLLDQYGKVVLIYDGVNARKFTAEHHVLSPEPDTESCTAATVLSDAYADARTGGYYLLFASNSSKNNASGGSRGFLVNNRVYGAQISITGVQFAEPESTEPNIKIGDNLFSEEGAAILINANGKVADYDFAIYSYGYAGRVIKNGWSECFVIDMSNGKVVRIYDGVNGKYFDAENTGGVANTENAYYTIASMSFDAFESLQPGEILVLGFNGGKNNNAGRTFLSANRTVGADFAAPNVALPTPASNEVEIHPLVVDGDKYYLSSAILEDAKAVAAVPFLIYNYGFDGALVSNSYGVAFVISAGKIVRVYDGANAKYYDAENTSGIQDANKCTAAGYLAEAFASLQEGEYVLCAPNAGTEGNVARGFLLDHRAIGKEVLLPEFEEEPEPAILIGEKGFVKEDIKIAYNDATATHASHDFLIFTTEFVGSSALTNGYGEAFVISGGKIVRIYDGANGKYYDAENASGIQDNAKCTANDYFKMALASLQANEWLLVAPNDGGSNAARGFLTSNKVIGASVVINAIEVTPSENAAKVLGINLNRFYNPTVLINGHGNVADYDFAIYSYGYAGRVIKNGWSECFVIDMSNGKVVRIYDGVNGKYFDAENTGGVANTDSAYYTIASMSFDAFESLQPGEILVLGFNGGKNNNAGRTFLSANRTIGGQAVAVNVELPVPAAEEVAIKTLTVNGDKFYLTADMVAYNNAAATHASHKFLIFTTEFSGSSALTNGYGEAFVISGGKIVRIYDGANGKYYDADNTSGIQDAEKCTANDYFKMALASLQADEWLLVAPNDGGSNAARGFLTSNKVIGASVSIDAVEVVPSENALKYLGIGANKFYNPSLIINASGAVASNDFAVYSYGYAGRVIKNGWSECFVIDMSNGKVVRIYDGVNGKYFDAENTGGVANTDSAYYTIASMSFDAFESLQPGEILVLGFNGGKNSNAGRTFMNANRTINAQASAVGVDLPAPSEVEVNIRALTVDGDKYYLTSAILEDGDVESATVPFLIYNYGFDGALVSNSYGVAFVISAGKIVRIYDGASAKYFDAENTSGIQNAEKCTAAGYLAEAFASLQEGEYVLCAPNGGTAGNVARGFLYDHRSIGKDITPPVFE